MGCVMFIQRNISRMLAIVLCFILIACISLPAMAAVPALSSPVLYATQYSENGESVILVSPDGEEPEQLRSHRSAAPANTSATLPESYDSRALGIVTPPRDQRAANLCWTFASFACLETSAIKQGFSSLGNTDYSEAHAGWFAQNPVSSDAEDEGSRDGVNQGVGAYTGMSRWEVLASSLMKGSGAAYESSYPYSKVFRLGEPIAANYPESARYDHSAATLATAYCMTYEQGFDDDDMRNAVKAAILENGSISAAIYYDDAYALNNGKYYWCRTITATNHDICIIGWDDNISRARFASSASGSPTPYRDGAWLVKNSWGTSQHDGGYFWLSYADMSLTRFSVFIAGRADAYENVYQYDGTYTWDALGGSVSPTYGMNIYTAEQDEDLVMVGCRTIPYSCTTTLSVYTGLTGTTPESGTLAATTTIDTPYAGYYTAQLPSGIQVKEGERFAVVISCWMSGKYYIPVEGEAPGAVNEAGQSYMGSGTYPVWYEMNPSFGNVCAKVYTKASAGHSHRFGSVQYDWTEDLSSCTAHTVCADCGERVDSPATVSVAYNVRRCSEGGTKTVTASFADARFETQTKTVDVAPGDHSYGEPVYSWSEDYSVCAAEVSCSVCGTRSISNSRSTVTVAEAGDCVNDTVIQYDAKFTNAPFTSQSKTVVEKAPGTHEWGAWITQQEPTDTDLGIAVRTCGRCGCTESKILTGDPGVSSENAFQKIIAFLQRLFSLLRNLFK